MKKVFSSNSILKNKFLVASVISLTVLLILLLLEMTFGIFFTQVNLYLQNSLYTTGFSRNNTVYPKILIVTIDDATLKNKKDGGLGRWQDFKRSYYATVIDHLHRDGAAVIGMDVLFSEESTPKEDLRLRDSIKNAGNVIIGFSKGDSNSASIFPMKPFEDAAFQMGFFNPITNSANFGVYSLYPVIPVGNMLREAFSISVVRSFFDVLHGTKTFPQRTSMTDSFYSLYPEDGIYIPYAAKQSIAGEQDKEVLINYIPERKKFPYLSFIDVYNNKYDASRVKDTIVLIGSTATALHDEFPTPVGILPGVYVHANMVNTLLSKKYIQYLSVDREIIILICFIFLITLIGVYTRNKFYIITSALLLSIGYFYAYRLMFYYGQKIFSYPVTFFIGILASFTFINVYRYIYEDRGKRLLKNTLSQYLAEDLVINVLSNYEEVRLGGTRREITTFFSDIEGFTTFSENMEPEELVRFLSIYLKDTSDIIMHHRGFINKYEGDAIMALWGAFGEEINQSQLACAAALEQQEKIREFNIAYKEQFGVTINVRMGINKGPAVVGNIGSLGKKIEYTALGDVVNTASRLEGINKMYNTNICVGETLYLDAKTNYIFRLIDTIRAKGKNIPSKIYELVGHRSTVSEDRLRMIKKYEQTLEYYYHQEFEKARDAFYDIFLEAGDKTSQIFAQRCEKYILNPPPSDWDGVYSALEK